MQKHGEEMKYDEFKSSDIKFINPINSQWNCNIFFKSPGLSEDLHKQIFSTRFSSSIDNEKVAVENLSEYLENVTVSFNDISVPQSLVNSEIGIELLIEIYHTKVVVWIDIPIKK